MPLATSEVGRQCPAAHTSQSNQWFSGGLIFWPFIWYFTENPSLECLQLFSHSLLPHLGYFKVIIQYKGGWSESFYCQKKIEGKDVCNRPTGRGEWSEESSLRTDELLSWAAGKITFFPRETVPLYGSTSHLICSLHLCVSDSTWMLLYLHRHSFLRRKLAVVTAHNSNTVKESGYFFQGKAEVLQFYCSFKI